MLAWEVCLSRTLAFPIHTPSNCLIRSFCDPWANLGGRGFSEMPALACWKLGGGHFRGCPMFILEAFLFRGGGTGLLLGLQVCGTGFRTRLALENIFTLFCSTSQFTMCGSGFTRSGQKATQYVTSASVTWFGWTLVGKCSATRYSVAAPPPGARHDLGGPMHPRHPRAVAEREVRQGPLGGV